jgi:hypothetical protein
MRITDPVDASSPSTPAQHIAFIALRRFPSRLNRSMMDSN